MSCFASNFEECWVRQVLHREAASLSHRKSRKKAWTADQTGVMKGNFLRETTAFTEWASQLERIDLIGEANIEVQFFVTTHPQRISSSVVITAATAKNPPSNISISPNDTSQPRNSTAGGVLQTWHSSNFRTLALPPPDQKKLDPPALSRHLQSTSFPPLTPLTPLTQHTLDLQNRVSSYTLYS
jgi:hypothetical protein